MNDLLQAALAYAARGWHVLPCNPGGKEPLGELAPKGFYDASTDAAVIQGWWSRRPNANIGVAVAASRLVLVDVDHKAGRAHGLESWHDLLQRHGQRLGDTVTDETPSGGLHVLYRANGHQVANSNGALGDDIEVKASSGYFVAPPSVFDGKTYQWASNHAPDECDLSPFPDSLADQLQERKSKPVAPIGAGIPEHQRNSTLTSLAGTMRRRGMSQEAIAAALLEENRRCAPPLPEREVLAIAASVARYDPAAEPEHCSDAGNARRLVALFGADIRYCSELGGWFFWDGRHWALDRCGQMERYAKQVAQSIYNEAAQMPDDVERKALGKWALASESQRAINAMIALAQSELGMPAKAGEFDRGQELLNCLNGTLDLHTGQLREHRREDLITKLCPLDYDPSAQAPTWERFQEQITAGDAELQAFKQRGYGYSLTGDVSEQVFFILYGTGSNGKSTELNAVKDTLGPDYAVHTPTETLLAKERGGGIPNDLARLQGVRMVTALEADAGKKLAEGLVKQLTGGDTLTARFLHQEFFSFQPCFKLFLGVNHKPEIRGTDYAIWRRIRLVPYTVTIAEEEKDRALPAKLQAEAAGILAWLVRGCLQWQADGLGSAQAVRAATEAYRVEQDLLSEFLADRCTLDRRASVSKADLYQAYSEWCDAQKEKELSKRTFGEKLKERGIGDTKGSHGLRSWVGIGLLAEDQSPSGGTGGTVSQVPLNSEKVSCDPEKSATCATCATCATRETLNDSDADTADTADAVLQVSLKSEKVSCDPEKSVSSVSSVSTEGAKNAQEPADDLLHDLHNMDCPREGANEMAPADAHVLLALHELGTAGYPGIDLRLRGKGITISARPILERLVTEGVVRRMPGGTYTLAGGAP